MRQRVELYQGRGILVATTPWEIENVVRRLAGVEEVRAWWQQDKPHLHVVVRQGDSPKNVARSVVSLVQTVLDLAISLEHVAIVQIGGEGEQTASGELARIQVIGYGVRRGEEAIGVQCRFRYRDQEFQGESQGNALLETVAAAAVDGINRVLGDSPGMTVGALSSVALASDNVVLVTLKTDEEETLVGAALVRETPEEAVIRAVLAGTNRRVSQLMRRISL